jgi:hypothetical protein
MPKAAASRPFILVLAGVNGAGKSSVGGAILADHGLTWFNPDTYNSAQAAPGHDIPDPVLVLEMQNGEVLFPGQDDIRALESTPDWARAIVQAAVESRLP